jgi:hypothetical protein
MTDDRLLDRLAQLDPATPDRIAAASGGADELRRRIEAEEIDVLAIHRRARRRRIATVAAAAAVTAALLVPLILLLPLGDDDTSTIGITPTPTAPTPTSTTGPTATSEPTRSPVDHRPPGPIEVTEPARGATVTSPVTISGTADVFEATVSIRILDSNNNALAETFTTATCGTGCRGDYSIDVPFSVTAAQPGVIQVFEVSAKDGSMINIVRVPVTLAPEDPVAAAVEGVWRDANGDPVPDGRPASEPLVLDVSEGPEHCGLTSVTFMAMGWPPGTEAPNGGAGARQFVRDPTDVVSDRTAQPFAPNAALPPDAEYTGLHRGDFHLWVAPSDSDEAIYVVNGDPAAGAVVERWPRVVRTLVCV